MSTAISGCILSHTDIQDCPRRLNQRILILTFPLDVLHDPSISNTIDGISVLHGVVIVQQIGCQIIGMVYYQVGVDIMKMILQILYIQKAQTKRVHYAVFSTVNIEKTSIHRITDKTVNTGYFLFLISSAIINFPELRL